MSNDPDRAAEWLRTKGIEAMLGPKGGIAVWFRRDEMQSYASVRGGAGFVECVTELAILQNGFDSLINSIADVHGCTPDELRKAIAVAGPEIGKHMHHAARVRSAAKS